MQVPAFLLRRIYVKGSLRNTGDGFEFHIHNRLGSGYAEALLPLKVDGQEVPLAESSFSVDGESVPFAVVNAERPFTLGMGLDAAMQVHGRTLEPGKHTITIGFVVVGLGQMEFDVSDEVAAG